MHFVLVLVLYPDGALGQRQSTLAPFERISHAAELKRPSPFVSGIHCRTSYCAINAERQQCTSVLYIYEHSYCALFKSPPRHESDQRGWYCEEEP
jgi:hypothetical protein